MRLRTASSGSLVLPGSSGASGADPEEEVLQAMYEAYSGPVAAYAARLTGDAGIAEDVVQETFLRAWSHLHRLDPDRSPLPWLMVVTRNVCYSMGRRRLSRPAEAPLHDHAARSGLDGSGGGGLGTDEALLDGVVVAEALGRLGANHRVVLVETFIDGFSAAEVANRLGIPVGTVKSRIYYGLRALRNVLEEMGLAP